MKILENISLKNLNTFGVEAKARFYSEINNVEEAVALLKTGTAQTNKILVLGGGSNVLFLNDFEGLLIKNNLKGIEVIDEDETTIELKVGAGEIWHEFVMYCIENQYCGLENLSLIPGNVGAAPMQNIGAYGVEVKSFITQVNALNIKTQALYTFKNEACDFGYRTSIFKTSHKNQFLITSVQFKLSKTPQLNTSYGAIEQELEKMNISSPTIRDVSNAVIAIRSSKLPNPNELGNAGSFFKNPIVSNELIKDLQRKYPNLPVYPLDESTSKIAAGWLIEQCGWKGKKFKNCGVHEKQALVLVNYGGASGKEIFELSDKIINNVKDTFGVELEREVNIIS
ncbi:MAG: UDP-N-acetylmuramate dehydrogenase [Vicingaceae bacterium]